MVVILRERQDEKGKGVMRGVAFNPYLGMGLLIESLICTIKMK